jgi:hypothetical protein
MKEPHTVIECGHLFCKDCVLPLLGTSCQCPECNMPAIVKNCKINPSQSVLVECVDKLQQLMNRNALTTERDTRSSLEGALQRPRKAENPKQLAQKCVRKTPESKTTPPDHDSEQAEDETVTVSSTGRSGSRRQSASSALSNLKALYDRTKDWDQSTKKRRKSTK